MPIDGLRCADVEFDGPLGSAGAEMTRIGENEFRVRLDHAPEHPVWSNKLQFSIDGNAEGNDLALEVEFDGGTRCGFDEYFYSYSYDGRTWTPVHWEEEPNGERNRLVFPTFAEDHVTVGHQVPLTYRRLTELIAEWRDHEAVEVTTVGASMRGRNIYRVTVGTASGSAADTEVHYVANQHPGEHNAQWRIVGMIEWLLGEAPAELLEANTCHFVVMMSPDGPANGWYRTNAAGVDMNRSYRVDGADPEEQTREAYLCQDDLEAIASRTGLTTVWTMHTWGGRVEPLLLAGPEFEGDREWTGLRDAIEAVDDEELCKPLALNEPSESKRTHWDVGPHAQFGVTSVLCEGAGALCTKAENKSSGEALIRGLLGFYSDL